MIVLLFSLFSYLTGYHECEILGGGLEAAESEYQWHNCTKNQGHKQFIPVQAFLNNQLPCSLTKDAHARLRAHIDVTVRVRVNWTSLERPDSDVLAEYRGLARARLGTGIICNVKAIAVDGPSPIESCQTCQGHAKKYWTFYVHTAHHVVYNTEEAKHARVDLFYDDERADEDGRMKSVRALAVGWSGADRDVSSLLCGTCDESLADRILSLQRRWEALSRTYQQSLASPIRRSFLDRCRGWLTRNYALIVSHPHGQPKQITVGKVVRKLDKRDGDGIDYAEYLTATCPGSSGSAVVSVFLKPRVSLLGSHYYRWSWWVHSGSCSKHSTNQVNYGNF